MAEGDIPHIIYLLLWLALIAGGYMAHDRMDLSKAFKQALIWLIIFASVAMVIGLTGLAN